MRFAYATLAFLVASISPSMSAAEPPSAVGLWLVSDGGAVVEIAPCRDKLCGTIVWAELVHGTLLPDRKNPDPQLRQRPVCGITMMHDFRQVDAHEWGDGRIYNPQDGKTYSATLTLEAPDLLKLRGYVLLPLLGKTQTWTRAPAGFPSCGHG